MSLHCRILLGGLWPGRPERHHSELCPHQRPVVIWGGKWRWGAAFWFLWRRGASTWWSQLFIPLWVFKQNLKSNSIRKCLIKHVWYYHRCLILNCKTVFCVCPDQGERAEKKNAIGDAEEEERKPRRKAYVHKPFLYSRYYSDSDDEITVEERRRSAVSCLIVNIKDTALKIYL